jgi:hypothetical protein
MSPAQHTLPSTGIEFSQRQFDQARLDLLRHRVTTFGTVVGILLILLAGLQMWASSLLASSHTAGPGYVGTLTSVLVGLAIIIMPRIRRRHIQQTTLRSLVWRTIWIVIISVISQVIGARVLSAGITLELRQLGFDATLGPIFVLVIFMVVLHTAAALIVPWTVLEASVPPLAWAGTSLFASLAVGNDSADFMVMGVSLTLLSGFPGVGITFFRASGLRETLGLRLIGARYAEIERELHFARRLHERLFPRPVHTGPIRIDYAYEPMRQIGGDFIDITRAQDHSLKIVMIDVTGHGIAAALAVNRLHGELKRIFAQSSQCTPADIIHALNSYVNLTLSDESVFATAVAVQVWPNGRARLCVAGHPSPLLRSACGAVSSISATAAMLGPFPPDVFDAEEVELQLNPGETLMLYTDGAIESTDTNGRLLGQSAFEQLFAEITDLDNLSNAVLQQVNAYRHSDAEDDVLITTITVGNE